MQEGSNKRSNSYGTENWFQHFRNLLGNEALIEVESEEISPIFNYVNIKDDAFSMEEYEKVKSNLVGGKACGEDRINPEILKYCNFEDIILDICNTALIQRDIPRQWAILNIIPIPKSGDLRSTSNYRGISLSSVVAKAYNKMILNRIKTGIDDKLRINQNGFRNNRNTTGHILAMRRILEGAKKKNLPALFTFIDFKKAFDTVHRGKMFKILRAYGIPDILVSAIQNMNRDTQAKVISPDGETRSFNIQAGVLQGDTLAPYLFVIVLDYVLRRATVNNEERLGFTLAKRQSKRINPTVITDCDFADDIVLLSNEIEQAQIFFKKVEKETMKVGLHVNSEKTKYLALNQRVAPEIITADGTNIEYVDDYKYLGSWIGSTEKDISIRKTLAWKASNKLSQIWKSSLRRHFKIRVFKATVEPILLYRCETWTLTNILEKQLDGCYTRMLRATLGISWRDHVSNTDLYSGLPKISDVIRQRRLRFAGHCFRMCDEVVADLVLWEPRHGSVSRGRPTTHLLTGWPKIVAWKLRI